LAVFILQVLEFHISQSVDIYIFIYTYIYTSIYVCIYIYGLQYIFFSHTCSVFSTTKVIQTSSGFAFFLAFHTLQHTLQHTLHTPCAHCNSHCNTHCNTPNASHTDLSVSPCLQNFFVVVMLFLLYCLGFILPCNSLCIALIATSTDLDRVSMFSELFCCCNVMFVLLCCCCFI